MFHWGRMQVIQCIYACYTMHTIPTNYTEAINSEYSEYRGFVTWKEFDSFVENDTFEWLKAPKAIHIVGIRWIYTLKYKQDGNYEYTVRFVSKGYSQICGIDYRENFAQTTNMASIRLQLQAAVQYDLLIHHMDAKSAYLNVSLDNEIYAKPPKGFEGKMRILFWNIKKSLYGLKQSGRTWNKTFHTFLITQSFEQSPEDSCMYIQNVNQVSIIVLWLVGWIFMAYQPL